MIGDGKRPFAAMASPALIRLLEAQAEREGCTVSELAERLLWEYVRQRRMRSE
jgi:hypothetical protein